MSKKKIKKKDMDGQLLDSIFAIEREWKQIESIMEKSIEPSVSGRQRETLAQAKYLFLLREARRRKVSAIRYR
ncbi:YaaL family protein [Virgibacillus sp. C22-A2]|uniref:YaaL family protein n=1 Tax=Virgibacillus tibetensis TaxID=3042313 RepID=A0ABU6KI71_9BACI|nr:YaaL family protein [Virgibacillus sp. C22-A2]